jgi:hypothetical protein
MKTPLTAVAAMNTRLALYVLALAGLTTVGCYAHRALAGPLAAALDRPRDVRVTRADGSRIRLRSAHVVGDSLVGRDLSGFTPRSLAIALTDVQRVEAEQWGWWSTAITVALIAGGIALLIAGMAIQNMGPIITPGGG